MASWARRILAAATICMALVTRWILVMLATRVLSSRRVATAQPIPREGRKRPLNSAMAASSWALDSSLRSRDLPILSMSADW